MKRLVEFINENKNANEVKSALAFERNLKSSMKDTDILTIKELCIGKKIAVLFQNDYVDLCQKIGDEHNKLAGKKLLQKINDNYNNLFTEKDIDYILNNFEKCNKAFSIFLNY